MKTKMCILALLAVSALSPSLLGRETPRGGIVNGPKAGFNIAAPDGWVVDTESGKHQDLPCVLYPKGESWADAKTVMYAKMASPQYEGVNAFVEMAIKEMKAKHGTPKEKIASGKTKDGHDYFINEYPATKTYSQWERVGYVQLPQGVAYIVLTSRDKASYQRDSGALEKVLKTLVYVEPKSEVASGQEYAHRYRQLVDQHAEGQIEPLLTEWREKAPDDPDAWITSANYYFNQRQTNISPKKPGPGDITLTDKKGKIAGSISFEQVEGSMKRATDLLEEATTKFPDHLDIWCGLAFMYQESGDFDNELATLKKMVAYAREHPAQLKWLKGEPLSEPADKVIPEKLHDYGLYYERKENAEDAERWFQISTLASQQYPSDVNAWIDIGGYYADMSEWKKAIESFEKARALNPKSQMILVNLARFSLELKDNAGARKYFEEGLKVDPKGDYAQEAKEALRKLKKKPEDRQTSQPNLKEANAYNERGIAKGVKGDIDGAIADYTRAIELDPRHTISYNNRGAEKLKKGDFDGAITDCNRAIELDPEYADAYAIRAYAKDKTGDSDGAMADLGPAIKLNPKDASAYDLRAELEARKKQYAAAIKDEQKAIELDPKNGRYYSNLGWCELFDRKPHESIAVSLKALELSPDKAVMIKGNLAHGYLFDNQFEKAKALYLENKDAKLHDGRAFNQAVLDDFKDFQEAGITHPDMEKIKALLTTETKPR
jgi:tetratricopeptide (TPR) repeat protein